MEIWENSNPSAAADLIGARRGLWIFNGVVCRIESKLTIRADTIDELITATYVSLIGVPISVVSAIAALALVWKLQSLQQQAVGQR